MEKELLFRREGQEEEKQRMEGRERGERMKERSEKWRNDWVKEG